MIAKARASLGVSGRRKEKRSVLGEVIDMIAVLKNAGMGPIEPRSSQGVPGPGASRLPMRSYSVFIDAICTSSGAWMFLAMARTAPPPQVIQAGIITPCAIAEK